MRTTRKNGRYIWFSVQPVSRRVLSSSSRLVPLRPIALTGFIGQVHWPSTLRGRAMKSSPGSPPRTRGRTGRSRAVPVAGAVLALAGLLAGCHAGGSGSGSGGAGASLTELTVAATPGVADAPLYLAESQGLFAKAGLRVRIDSETSATT